MNRNSNLNPAFPAGHPGLAWGCVLLSWLVILFAFREQVALVVHAWDTLPSHAHGYVVLLVVAWLVWDKRSALIGVVPCPSRMGLVAFALAALMAFVGEMVSAGVVVQFAVVFMLQSAVWAVLGSAVFRVLCGPLNFLLFAIPFGQGVLPTLMDWTANATVLGLRLSGVPVFQQDRFFVIPSGSWSVVEACSGVRYLLTSFFVGTIFAYITYVRWFKRVVFVLWMLLLSLLANWVRAYVIVMVAHFSDNQWGLGLSHLALGWVIFAATILISFAVGMRWSDPAPALSATPPAAMPLVPAWRLALFALLTSGLAVLAIQSARDFLDLAQGPSPVLDLSPALGDLVRVSPATERVLPRFEGASAQHDAVYRFDDGEVSVSLAYYRNQRQGAELINVNNLVESSHSWIWDKSAQFSMTDTRGQSVELREEYFSKGNVRTVAAVGYWIGGRVTSNEMMGKLYQALSLVKGQGDDGAMVVVTASTVGNARVAKLRLEAFLQARLPRLLDNLEAIRAAGVPQ